MDIKTFNLINRLPDYIPSSLNANKGNSATLSSLLETYTKSGAITFEESNILYSYYMTGDDDAPAQTRTAPQPEPQPRPRPNPQPAPPVKPAPSSQKSTAVSTELKKARTDYIIFLVITIFMLPITVIAIYLGLFGTASETAFPAGNLANCIDTVSADNDYLIYDAKIIAKYAEFYKADAGEIFVDDSEKTDVKDLYAAIITDKEGKEYFTSISVDRTSELGIKLDNHDFMSSRYTLSGYFTAQPLTAHTSETKTGADFFDELIEKTSYLDIDPVRWDFKYLFPSTADYAEEKAEAEEPNAEGIVIAVIFFIATIVLLDMTYNRRKKYMKLKKG